MRSGFLAGTGFLFGQRLVNLQVLKIIELTATMGNFNVGMEDYVRVVASMSDYFKNSAVTIISSFLSIKLCYNIN
jgi:hypothetical protein